MKFKRARRPFARRFKAECKLRAGCTLAAAAVGQLQLHLDDALDSSVLKEAAAEFRNFLFAIVRSPRVPRARRLASSPRSPCRRGSRTRAFDCLSS